MLYAADVDLKLPVCVC